MTEVVEPVQVSTPVVAAPATAAELEAHLAAVQASVADLKATVTETPCPARWAARCGLGTIKSESKVPAGRAAMVGYGGVMGAEGGALAPAPHVAGGVAAAAGWAVSQENQTTSARGYLVCSSVMRQQRHHRPSGRMIRLRE